jgi:CubicO group peptidase (beta-lactamase class C family)
MIKVLKLLSPCLIVHEKTSSSSFFYVPALAVLLSATACNAPASGDPGKAVHKAGMIELPAPGAIEVKEKIRLQNTCAHWFDSVLGRTNFNGGMLVAKKGQIIFEKYKGSPSLKGADSVNAETVFHIASVSKTFTAMAVMKLWEEGKLNPDDELVKYFPAFNYPGVTIRTLLNHRSGLPNYLYFMEKLKWNDSIVLKNKDILETLINRKAELEDISQPNTHFTYCNTNYVLLALVIEKVTGLTYPQYIKQTFFDPLQMTHSFVYTPADTARVTHNYDWRGQEIRNNYLDDIYGDKNIYTTPRDLLIWHRALTSQQLFRPETLAAAYQPYSNERPGVKNYGLGWRMNIYPNGKKVIFHNGWWHGNNAAFVRLLDEDVVIIVMGNRFTQATYRSYKLINSFGNYFEVMEEIE